MQTELERQHARHKAFLSSIATRASRVQPIVKQTYSIPNAPYGAPKILPPRPVKAAPTPIPGQPKVMFEAPYELLTVWSYFPYCGSNDVEPVRKNAPASEEILRATARHFKRALSDLTGPSRLGHFVLPRQVAMYLCRRLTKRSLPQIGRRFGGRDHTTVLHAFNKIAYQIEHRISQYGHDVAFDVEMLLRELSAA